MSFSLGPLSPKEQALLAGPAAAPPPGVSVGPLQPTTIDHGTIATITVCMVLDTLAVMMRLWSRTWIAGPLHIEDAFIVLALLAHIAASAFGGLAVAAGVGKHMWEISLYDFVHALYYISFTGGVYCLGMLFTKAAIVLQFLRIFVPTRQFNFPLWTVCWSALTVISIFYIINTFIQFFPCDPWAKGWNPFIQTGTCMDTEAIYKATGVFNVLSDFALLFIPLWGIWQLHMKIERKIAVSALFFVGFLTCVASIVRTYYSFRVYQDADVSYNTAAEGYAMQAELTLGLLVPCMPVAPQFCRYSLDKARSIKQSFSRLTSTGSIHSDIEQVQMEVTDKSSLPSSRME